MKIWGEGLSGRVGGAYAGRGFKRGNGIFKLYLDVLLLVALRPPLCVIYQQKSKLNLHPSTQFTPEFTPSVLINADTFAPK